MPRSRRTRPSLLHVRLLVAAGLAIASGCGRGDSPDLLLLISVDTLRSDHLGAYGSQLGATPHLDQLAAESLVFTAAYAPTSHTLPSVSALMTGSTRRRWGS
jgi:predicted AlkP superfamily pyrophosphatase or phosphodiesterase